MQTVINFFVVLACAVCVAGSVSSLYATGLRLWSSAEVETGESGKPHLGPRIWSVVCFAACVVIVLFALWLMIPMFH